MGPDFLSRIFRNTILLGVVLALAVGVRIGWGSGLEFLVATLWGALNLRFLQFVIVEATRQEGVRWTLLLAGVFLKFPLLYGAGIGWIAWRKPAPALTLAGLGVVFVVLILQTVGRAMVEAGYWSRPVPRGGKSQ